MRRTRGRRLARMVCAIVLITVTAPFVGTQAAGAGPIGSWVYRFYAPGTGSHFYTISELEKQFVSANLAGTYIYEGAAFIASPPGAPDSVPVHRFYNKKSGTHFYTISEVEKANVIAKFAAIYVYEGVAFNVTSDSMIGFPVYRFYNKQNGTHFYTISAPERDYVMQNHGATYVYEGIAFWARPTKGSI